MTFNIDGIKVITGLRYPRNQNKNTPTGKTIFCITLKDSTENILCEIETFSKAIKGDIFCYKIGRKYAVRKALKSPLYLKTTAEAFSGNSQAIKDFRRKVFDTINKRYNIVNRGVIC